ncbi:hypothetical protein TNCV_2950431 [Trichonephila clavipes]|nr:hypothetical protein TNCV_2950431 [Trichonephila clavipes]
MASPVLADPTRALQGTNRGIRLAMEESEIDVGSLEQLLLYADEHYLAGKLPMGEPFRKGPTWGRRISSTYRWPVKVSRIKIKVDRLS